jgi:hypothetical protein
VVLAQLTLQITTNLLLQLSQLVLLVQLVPQALLVQLDRLDLLVLQAPFQDQQDLQALLVLLAQ